MADDKRVMSQEEYDKLPEETKEALLVNGILRQDITNDVMRSISEGRYDEAQKIVASNQEKSDLQRDVNFAKNDVYNAGMAANFVSKVGTLSKNANKNKEDLAEARKEISTPRAIQNQALQQALSGSQYAQARGLGQDVIGNRNAQNNQAYINALDASRQSSNQAGNFQSQNQALFNKKLMADRGTADMQLQYQQMANQNLARNIAGSQAQDAAQNNFNMNSYNARQALRSRDIGRGENRVDSFRNAQQETLDTAPYLGAKMAGDYTHMNQQRNLDPNRRFMNNQLFAKQQQNRYLQAPQGQQIMGKQGVPQFLNRNTQPVQRQPDYWNTRPNMQQPVLRSRNAPEYLDINADPYTEKGIYNY